MIEMSCMAHARRGHIFDIDIEIESGIYKRMELKLYL